jgi:hypothetical protein
MLHKNTERKTGYFDIITGVRQGCVLSPFLFLLVMDFVMNHAMKSEVAGITWGTSMLRDLDFADDIALLATKIRELKLLTEELQKASEKVGLHISHEKSKIMATEDAKNFPIYVSGGQVEQVGHFTYLGSTIALNGEVLPDITARIGKAGGVFQKLLPIWRMCSISLRVKIFLFRSIVLPVMLYACETWKSSKAINHKVDVFMQRCLRKIMGITWRDHITNEIVLQRARLEKPSSLIMARRVRFAGHIWRMGEERPAKIAMEWLPKGGRRKRGRPQKTWRSCVKDDFKTMGLSWDEARSKAQDREDWRSLVDQCLARDRRN